MRKLAFPIQVRETEWLRACTAWAVSYFVAIRDAARSARRSRTAAAVTGRVRRSMRGTLARPDEHWYRCRAWQRFGGARQRTRRACRIAGGRHHRQVSLELRGAYAEWLLAAVCPLPLDVEVFPVDACTRTVFAKAEIVVWRTGLDAFRVEVARSYCRYVVDLLGEVARELPASPRGAGGVPEMPGASRRPVFRRSR